MGVGPTNKQFDFVRQFTSLILNVINKKRQEGTGLCDGWVLKLHYKLTFWFFITGYVGIWYSWWHKDILTCVNHFNAEKQVRSDFLNICTSYLYIPDDNSFGGRKYLLFYRWTHWVLVVLAFLYYIPRKLSKMAENPKARRMFDEFASNPKYRNEDSGAPNATRYFLTNQGTYNNVFTYYFVINICSLLVNITVFYLIDMLLLGNFADLLQATWPFNRDVTTFSDELTLRFPPFADCTIDPINQLLNKRTEVFGCHLTYMELYEKYFIVMWVWLVTVAFLTVGYILYLSLFFLPTSSSSSVRTKLLLRYFKPHGSKEHDIQAIDKKLNELKFGDFYVVYRFKSILTLKGYYEFLKNISIEEDGSEGESEESYEMNGREEGPKMRSKGNLAKNLPKKLKPNYKKDLGGMIYNIN